MPSTVRGLHGHGACVTDSLSCPLQGGQHLAGLRRVLTADGQCSRHVDRRISILWPIGFRIPAPSAHPCTCSACARFAAFSTREGQCRNFGGRGSRARNTRAVLSRCQASSATRDSDVDSSHFLDPLSRRRSAAAARSARSSRRLTARNAPGASASLPASPPECRRLARSSVRLLDRRLAA